MKSIYYQGTLVNAYVNQELTAEDFENTLMHFAKLYHQERSKAKKACNNCGCPEPELRHDHLWCRVCHNEMNV